MSVAAANKLTIALVAGEQSGDILGAGLMQALQQQSTRFTFCGIGGSRMQALGLQSLAPMEALSVMGLVEPLKHLPELLRIRRGLFQHFSQHPPAVFIGIDAPDFNLGLEQRLRQTGITTVHYVSPSVWAWRRWRIKKIARSVDLMLTLFPFEARFYEQAGIPVRCVGHPLADQIPLQADRDAARQALACDTATTLVALLPGSRSSEVERLAPLFLQTAQQLIQRHSGVQFIIPAATPALAQRLRALLTDPALAAVTRLVDGQAHTVMAAADAVLLASGTATLEAMLLKRPMVVAYRTAPLTAWLAQRLVKAPYFALPNLLAGERLVAEFFQEQATADALTEALLALLDDQQHVQSLQQHFMDLHQTLQRDASVQAATAIRALIADSSSQHG